MGNNAGGLNFSFTDENKRKGHLENGKKNRRGKPRVEKTGKQESGGAGHDCNASSRKLRQEGR